MLFSFLVSAPSLPDSQILMFLYGVVQDLIHSVAQGIRIEIALQLTFISNADLAGLLGHNDRQGIRDL